MICGMAGSRQGWIEAPYVATPARFDGYFRRRGSRLPGTRPRRAHHPGHRAARAASGPTCMRGEETQLAGIASLHDGADLLVCMPGTHCKWVQRRRRRGCRLRHLADRRAVLGAFDSIRSCATRSAPQPAKVSPDDPVFQRWLDDGLAHPGDALSRLFRIRASTLLLDMQPDAGGCRAVGAADRQRNRLGARQQFGDAGAEVVLVASGGLGDLYAAGARPRRLFGDARSTPTRPCATACSKRRAEISRSTPAGGPRHERAVAEAQARHRRHPARPRAAMRRQAIGRAVFEAGIEAIEVPLNSPEPFRSIEAIVADLPVIRAGRRRHGAQRRRRRAAACGRRPAAGQPQCRRCRARPRRRFFASSPCPACSRRPRLSWRSASGASALKFFPASVLGAERHCGDRRGAAEGHRRRRGRRHFGSRFCRLCQDRRPHLRPGVQPLQARHERGRSRRHGQQPQSRHGTAFSQEA